MQQKNPWDEFKTVRSDRPKEKATMTTVILFIGFCAVIGAAIGYFAPPFFLLEGEYRGGRRQTTGEFMVSLETVLFIQRAGAGLGFLIGGGGAAYTWWKHRDP